jgi:hypothetical protein
VSLADDSFLPEEFENVQGLTTVKWDRINAYPGNSHCAIRLVHL